MECGSIMEKCLSFSDLSETNEWQLTTAQDRRIKVKNVNKESKYSNNHLDKSYFILTVNDLLVCMLSKCVVYLNRTSDSAS